LEYDYLIRVYRHLDGGRREVMVGTAYPVAAGRILTARHVLADNEGAIDPSKLEITWFYHKQDELRFRSNPASVQLIWDGLKNGGETGKWDAVILKCEFPRDVKVATPILEKRTPAAHEEWESRGFPAIGIRDTDLEPTSLQGRTCGCHEADRKFQVIADGKGRDARGWRGASGAPVFVRGRILGLIIESCELTEGARIDAIPILRLLEISSFRDAVSFPATDRASIDTTRFKSKIVDILEKAPQALNLLETMTGNVDFQGEPISLRAKDGAIRSRASQLVDDLFSDFHCGKRLLEIALNECSNLKDSAVESTIMDVAYLFFPACFARNESENILTAYRSKGTALIDAKAASVASIELRMAAIEGRAADYDLDQTREDGPVGRKKIHDPPSFALEAIRSREFPEAFAKLLFERTFSRVQYRVKDYLSFRERINKQIELGKSPEGAPYIVLCDPGDKINAALTEEEINVIAQELRAQYDNLMVTSVSAEVAIIDRELEYLDWFWKKFRKNERR
jgi:hypothetical protein